MKRQTVLVLAGLSLFSSAASAQVTLLDANDRGIGYHLDGNGISSADVGMKFGERVLRIPVVRTKFLQTGRVYFTEPACAGAPYQSAQFQSLFNEFQVTVTFRSDLYLRKPGATLAVRTVVSRYGDAGCEDITPRDTDVYEARFVVKLKSVFQPPFRFVPRTEPLVDLSANPVP